MEQYWEGCQLIIPETLSYIELQEFDSVSEKLYDEASITYRHYKEGLRKQPWDPIRTERLAKILIDSARMGFVRDEQGVIDIAQKIIEITAKICLNTMLCGHGMQSPRYYLVSYIDEASDLMEKELEDFMAEYAYDEEQGCYRISDYALDSLLAICDEFRRCVSTEQLLAKISEALNIYHQRSDLSAWFISGGMETLNKLSNL